MEYKIVVLTAVKTFGTDFEQAARELTAQVNAEIQLGWEPLGGVNVGSTMSTREPYLLQAMIRRSSPPGKTPGSP